MATEDKNQPRSVKFSDGVSAGLKLWLFFLVSFFILGYSARMSILLGATGGLAGAWVVAWWKAKEEPRTQQQVEAIKASNPDDLAGAEIIKRQAVKTKVSRRKRRDKSPRWYAWKK